MVIKNICTVKTYDKNGETKKHWMTVGVLKEMEDGRQFIELSMFPNTAFYVFSPKEKDSGDF